MVSNFEKVVEPKDGRIADWHIQTKHLTRHDDKKGGEWAVVLTEFVVVASMYSSITDLIFKILLVQCPINSAIVF